MLGSILLLALGLRVWGIDHNVWIDENKVVNPSIAIAQAEGGILAVSPQTYYPHLTHYVLAAVFRPIHWSNPEFANEQYHVVARMVIALFSVITVAFTFLIGRRLGGNLLGAIAALLLAVMPLAVKYSHFAQVDVMAAFVMTVALWAALKVWDRGETRWYVLTGVLVGAAGAAQYWGFSIGAALVLAHLKRIQSSEWKMSSWLTSPFLASLVLIPVTFFAISPYWLVDLDRNLESFEKLQQRGAAGDLGYTRANILWPLYTRTPDWGLSFTRSGLLWETPWIVFAVALFGGALAVWKRDWKVAVMVGVLAVILYLAINGTLKLYAIKRLMPLTSLLALLAAYGVVKMPRRGRWVVLTLAVLMSVWMSAGFDAAYARPATHAQAVEWAKVNIPPGSAVLQHSALRLLDWDDKRWKAVRTEQVYANFDAENPEVERDRAKSLEQWIVEQGVEFIVMDSRLVDRYYEATSMKLYPEATASYRAFYDDVRTRGTLVYRIEPTLWQQAGARVEIYDVREVR